MKKRFLIALSIILSVLYSCKDDSSKKEINISEEKEVINNLFVITLDIIAKKNDNLHIYFTEDNTINFTEDKSAWHEIKGSEASQKAVFKLAEDLLPTNLRLDLGYGKNPEQKEIVVNSITFEYLNKTFVIKSNEIVNYFYPNKDNTILDAETGTLKRIKADQETAPSLYPHATLQDELLKLMK
jgi:hypothetical protein